MFGIGDQVLYGVQGACTIIGIETMRFGKTKGKYYCLQPVEQPDSRYYVPVESAESKLRPLMTREELLKLLHSEDVWQDNWIPEENLRKERCHELLRSGDRASLLNMIHCQYQHKQAMQQAGRKFHQCDDEFLHNAQKLLNSEFCLVFDLKPSQVNDFIREHLLDPQ